MQNYEKSAHKIMTNKLITFVLKKN